VRLVRNARERDGGKGGKPDPEFRLPSAIAGAALIPVGLFWFGWTSYRGVHWIVPIIGSVFFGTGYEYATHGRVAAWRFTNATFNAETSWCSRAFGPFLSTRTPPTQPARSRPIHLRDVCSLLRFLYLETRVGCS